MARRAGQEVAGFEKVRAWLKGGRAGVLLEAADGAPEGRAKLRALVPQVPVVDLLRAAELGAAFGREQAVHVVLAPGGLATKLNEEAARLAGFRSEIGSDLVCTTVTNANLVCRLLPATTTYTPSTHK